MNRLIVVTGGTKGIGAAIANHFEERGDEAVRMARTRSGEYRNTIACDVTKGDVPDDNYTSPPHCLMKGCYPARNHGMSPVRQWR